MTLTRSGFGIFPDHEAQYGAVHTYQVAADWLDGHGTVYDWGCGKGFSKQFFKRSPWVGIDGTFTDAKQDLADLRMPCDSILMRHVLENNQDTWQDILKNAIDSFSRRMVLVTFTQFAQVTHVYKTERYEHELPYLRFKMSDLTDIMGDLLVFEFAAPTTHPEHVFYLQK